MRSPGFLTVVACYGWLMMGDGGWRIYEMCTVGVFDIVCEWKELVIDEFVMNEHKVHLNSHFFVTAYDTSKSMCTCFPVHVDVLLFQMVAHLQQELHHRHCLAYR